MPSIPDLTTPGSTSEFKATTERLIKFHQALSRDAQIVAAELRKNLPNAKRGKVPLAFRPDLQVNALRVARAWNSYAAANTAAARSAGRAYTVFYDLFQQPDKPAGPAAFILE
jgi:hypothetical protein